MAAAHDSAHMIDPSRRLVPSTVPKSDPPRVAHQWIRDSPLAGNECILLTCPAVELVDGLEATARAGGRVGLEDWANGTERLARGRTTPSSPMR